MSRSVSAPSLVTNTSPCWNGFIVPGSTFRYGSSFCIVTRRPRALSSAPRLEAVRPLPREEATPPVTKMCLVVVDVAAAWPRGGSRGREVRCRRFRIAGCRRCGSGVPAHRSTGYQGISARGMAPATLRARRRSARVRTSPRSPFGGAALPERHADRSDVRPGIAARRALAPGRRAGARPPRHRHHPRLTRSVTGVTESS